MDMQNNQEETTQKSRPKGFVKPKPGGFPVLQKVVMSHTPGEEGTFIHDFEFVNTLTDVLAARCHPHEERLNNDPLMFDDYSDRINRMLSMLMARKLASSLSEDQKASYGGHLRPVANMPCWGPSALLPLIDLFGSVDQDKMRFSMVGQPIIAFTYFVRAVQNDLGNRREHIAINGHWPNAKRMLFDFARTAINTWATSITDHPFAFPNNIVVRMSIPTFNAGIAGYRAFIQGAELVPYVTRMMDIVAAIEPTLGQPFNAAQIAALAALNVGVVDWGSSMITTQGDNYATQVEARIRTSLSAVTNWVSVAALKNRGSAGQLLMKANEHMFYCPLMLGGEVLDLGWFASSGQALVRTNPRSCHLVPKETIRQGCVSYVEGMMKMNF